MNAEQTQIIEMSLNILNDIAQSLKTIAENDAARKAKEEWPTELKPWDTEKIDVSGWSTENIKKAMDAPFDFSSMEKSKKKPGEMTAEEAIRVLSMIECHGSLTQKAKERAIEALRKEEEG